MSIDPRAPEKRGNVLRINPLRETGAAETRERRCDAGPLRSDNADSEAQNINPFGINFTVSAWLYTITKACVCCIPTLHVPLASSAADRIDIDINTRMTRRRFQYLEHEKHAARMKPFSRRWDFVA